MEIIQTKCWLLNVKVDEFTTCKGALDTFGYIVYNWLVVNIDRNNNNNNYYIPILFVNNILFTNQALLFCFACTLLCLSYLSLANVLLPSHSFTGTVFTVSLFFPSVLLTLALTITDVIPVQKKSNPHSSYIQPASF